MHAGLEWLLRYGDPAEAHAALKAEFLSQLGKTTMTLDWQEALLLARAMFLGWVRAKWPSFQQQYEVLQIEKEIEVHLAPNVILQARADAGVRDRYEDRLYVLNWKTAKGRPEEGWTASWEDEVQMWTEALAMQDDLGQPVEGVIVEGLLKGGSGVNGSTSPLIRVNHRAGEWSWEHQRSKDWTRLSPEAFPGGLQGWIDFLPMEVLEAQYLRSDPILKNDEVVRAWLAQIVRMMTDVQRMQESDVSDADRMAFFSQSFGKFRCRFCAFRPLCKQTATLEEMLGSGKLRPRRNHHGAKN